MIYKFSKTLTYSDVKYHFFALTKPQCANLVGVDVQIECSDGSKYASKIDNQGRIKALQFFKDHPWAEEGDTFDFEIDCEFATVNIDLSNQDFDNVKYSAERELSPANEAEVRDFIAECIQKGQLDSLSLYQGIQGIEFDTKEVGRIDLLCTDQQGNFVVIEIKKDRSGDKVVGQIQRYMGWVKKHLAGDKDVRGIIVLRKHEDDFDADKQLLYIDYAVNDNPNISVKFYKMSLCLTDE